MTKYNSSPENSSLCLVCEYCSKTVHGRWFAQWCLHFSKLPSRADLQNWWAPTMHGTALQTCAHISEYASLNYVAKKCFVAKQDIRYIFKCKTFVPQIRNTRKNCHLLFDIMRLNLKNLVNIYCEARLIPELLYWRAGKYQFSRQRSVTNQILRLAWHHYTHTLSGRERASTGPTQCLLCLVHLPSAGIKDTRMSPTYTLIVTRLLLLSSFLALQDLNCPLFFVCLFYCLIMSCFET